MYRHRLLFHLSSHHCYVCALHRDLPQVHQTTCRDLGGVHEGVQVNDCDRVLAPRQPLPAARHCLLLVLLCLFWAERADFALL